MGIDLCNGISPLRLRIDERKATQCERGVELRHARVNAQPFWVIRADIAIIAHGPDCFRKPGIARGDQPAFAGNQELGRRERKYLCISEGTNRSPAIGAAEGMGGVED